MTYKKVPKIKRGRDGKYFMSPQDMVNSAKILDKIIYRMEEHGLFQVTAEYGDYYIGSWLMFTMNQSVPKKDLTILTDEEFEYWSTRSISISGVKVPLNITRD